jgi:hypothetical protein
VTAATEAYPNRHNPESFLYGSKRFCLSDVLILTKKSGLACSPLEFQQGSWPGRELMLKEGLDIMGSGLWVFGPSSFLHHASQRLNLHYAHYQGTGWAGPFSQKLE